MHFSFADYYDPSRMNFGALRVVNDDLVEPQAGFGYILRVCIDSKCSLAVSHLHGSAEPILTGMQRSSRM